MLLSTQHRWRVCVAAALSPCDPPVLIAHFRDLSFLFVLAGLSPVWRSGEKPGQAECRGGKVQSALQPSTVPVGQTTKVWPAWEVQPCHWKEGGFVGGPGEAALMLQALFMSMCKPLSQISVNSEAYCSQGAENMALSPCSRATAAVFVDKGHSALSGKMWLKLEMSGIAVSLYILMLPDFELQDFLCPLLLWISIFFASMTAFQSTEKKI